jgi:UDP-N-acetylmuramate--alanine ligase
MMRQGYIDVFSTMLRVNDSLIMPEIYYAGGSSNVIGGQAVPLPKDISSLELINEIKRKGVHASYLADRAAVMPALRQFIYTTDCIVVMGSRDETLPDLARSILEEI